MAVIALRLFTVNPGYALTLFVARTWQNVTAIRRSGLPFGAF